MEDLPLVSGSYSSFPTEAQRDLKNCQRAAHYNDVIMSAHRVIARLKAATDRILANEDLYSWNCLHRLAIQDGLTEVVAKLRQAALPHLSRLPPDTTLLDAFGHCFQTNSYLVSRIDNLDHILIKQLQDAKRTNTPIQLPQSIYSDDSLKTLFQYLSSDDLPDVPLSTLVPLVEYCTVFYNGFVHVPKELKAKLTTAFERKLNATNCIGAYVLSIKHEFVELRDLCLKQWSDTTNSSKDLADLEERLKSSVHRLTLEDSEPLERLKDQIKAKLADWDRCVDAKTKTIEEVLDVHKRVIEELKNSSSTPTANPDNILWKKVNRLHMLARRSDQHDLAENLIHAALPFLKHLPPDICIRDQNEDSIEVNSLALCKIPFFNRYFSNRMIDSIQTISDCLSDAGKGTIALKDCVNANRAFQAIVDYECTGKIELLSESDLPLVCDYAQYLYAGLAEESKEFQIALLKFFQEHMSPETAIYFYVLSQKHSLKELRDLCIKYWVASVQGIKDIHFLQEMFKTSFHHQILEKDRILEEVMIHVQLPDAYAHDKVPTPPQILDLYLIANSIKAKPICEQCIKALAASVKATSQFLKLHRILEGDRYMSLLDNTNFVRSIYSAIRLQEEQEDIEDAKAAYHLAQQYNIEHLCHQYAHAVLPPITTEDAFAELEEGTLSERLDTVRVKDLRQAAYDHLLTQMVCWFEVLGDAWDPDGSGYIGRVKLFKKAPKQTPEVMSALGNLSRLAPLLDALMAMPNPVCRGLSATGTTWLLQKLSASCHTLNLAGTGIERVTQLTKFRNLYKLSLASTKVTSLEGLNNITDNLEELDLSDSRITLIVGHILPQPRLRCLNLQNNTTIKLLEWIPRFPALRWVNLKGCPASFDVHEFEGITILR